MWGAESVSGLAAASLKLNSYSHKELLLTSLSMNCEAVLQSSPWDILIPLMKLSFFCGLIDGRGKRRVCCLRLFFRAWGRCYLSRREVTSACAEGLSLALGSSWGHSEVTAWRPVSRWVVLNQPWLIYHVIAGQGKVGRKSWGGMVGHLRMRIWRWK